MTAYVYRHRKLNSNEVFYIGIGIKKNYKRAFTKSGRNKHWKNTVSKYGYDIDILADNISWEDACELEIFLISIYGRKDLGMGTLVNMTDGGDGTVNMLVSEETRLKLSKVNKGRVHSIEARFNMSQAKKRPMKEKKPKKEKGIPIIQLDSSGTFIREWKSAKEAADTLNLQRTHITSVCKGRALTHGGYIWTYKS